MELDKTQDISSTDVSDLAQSTKVQTTSAEDVDRPDVTQFHQSTTWKDHNAYYKKHSSVKAVINKLGMWSVGKGYQAKKGVSDTLDKVRGSGKDTFDEVINNVVRGRHLDGDSYAEIIGGKGQSLLNLKPLNPGTMKVYYTDAGMIAYYAQVNLDGSEEIFDKEEIFHLSLNRIADETHGEGDIATLMNYLDKIKQIDEDMSVMFHRFIVPMVIWRINTDKASEVARFNTDQKNAFDKGQNLVIPNKAAEWDLMEPGKNGVDPLQWRQTWVEEVTKGGGVPALIMAIEAGTTEASSKMVYLAWQQVIEAEQMYLEKQIKQQLGLEVKFEFPASIAENLDDDQRKDGDLGGEKKSEIIPTKAEVEKK